MKDKLTEYKNYDELLKNSYDVLNSINIISQLDRTSVEPKVLSEFNNLIRKVKDTRTSLFKTYINNKVSSREKLDIEAKFPDAFEYKSHAYSGIYNISVFGERVCDSADMSKTNYDQFDDYLKKANIKLNELSVIIENNILNYRTILQENATKINKYIRGMGMKGSVVYIIRTFTNTKNNPVMEVYLTPAENSDIIVTDTKIELPLINLDLKAFLETLNYDNVIKNIYKTGYERTQAEANKYINSICEKHKLELTKFKFDEYMEEEFNFKTGTIGPRFILQNNIAFEHEFISTVNVISYLIKHKPISETFLELNAGSKYFYKPIYECKLNGDRYTIYDTKYGKRAILQVYKNGVRLGIRARRKIINQFLNFGRKLVEDCCE